MAEILTHLFVSAKADSPDTSLVSASEWNDGHRFTGGINGQVLMADNTQPKGIRWTDGPRYAIGSLAGAVTGTPTIHSPVVTLSVNSNAVVIVVYEYLAGVTGGTTYQFDIFQNGVAIGNYYEQPTGTQLGITLIHTLTAGTVTYGARFIGGTGFTQTNVTVRIIAFGN